MTRIGKPHWSSTRQFFLSGSKITDGGDRVFSVGQIETRPFYKPYRVPQN
ncbi:hypothetical protein JJD41_10435 [Oxynema sp. CENA135]|nr:hypothetical protein [Oxynema sp. CENA135]MBK4730276.1 hypothetical protein [Oxynema sp. CENA135]